VLPDQPVRGTRNDESQNPEAAVGTAALHGPRASRPPVGRPSRESISDTQGLAVLRRTDALVVYEPEQRI